MKIIHVDVTELHMTVVTEESLIDPTEDKVMLYFYPSQDWVGASMVASFTYNDVNYSVPILNRKCAVPPEMLRYNFFRLQVYRMIRGEITKTNKILITKGGA